MNEPNQATLHQCNTESQSVTRVAGHHPHHLGSVVNVVEDKKMVVV